MMATQFRPTPDVERVVIGIALHDRSWMAKPSILDQLTEDEIAARLTIQAMPTPSVLTPVLFFVVVDPTRKPGANAIIIAVTDERHGFLLRSKDDFQQLVRLRGLRIDSSQTAMDIATQYVRLLGSRYPRYWEQIRFLTSIADVPLRPGEVLPEVFLARFHPPLVQGRGSNFVVDFFTWTELGGQLKGFEFQISAEGQFAVTEITFAEDVGRAWLPK